MFLWFVAKSGNDTLDYKKRRNAMKKAFRIIGIVLALSLVVCLAISCDANTAPDGKTAQTKKSMTSAEYKANSKALEGMAVVEAYAMTQPEKAVSSSKSIAGEYKVVFDGKKTIKTSEIRRQLEAKAAAPDASPEKQAFYTALAASLPQDVEVSVEAGSYVKYRVDGNGVSHISSLDIEIMLLDGKTIEIKKDEDDKWIEIDGTFFDNSELERMLDAADDAADAIEEFFEELEKNIKNGKMDFKALISGKKTEIQFNIMDGEKKEAEIVGFVVFKVENNKFKTDFNFKYTEYDDGVEDTLTIEVSMTFDLSVPSIEDLDMEKLVTKINENPVSVKVNGTDVWVDAFIDELD